jgi:hypothetical protein
MPKYRGRAFRSVFERGEIEVEADSLAEAQEKVWEGNYESTSDWWVRETNSITCDLILVEEEEEDADA